MMDNEVVTGLGELTKKLTDLAPNIQRKLMRGALRAGMKVTLKQAKANVHDVSGDLQRSLRVSTRIGRDGVVRATVKAGNKDAFYAHMVEFGTASHVIEATGEKAVAFNGKVYSKIDHPGAKARPFMRPALDAAARDNSEVFQAVAAYLAPKINEHLASLPDEQNSSEK